MLYILWSYGLSLLGRWKFYWPLLLAFCLPYMGFPLFVEQLAEQVKEQLEAENQKVYQLAWLGEKEQAVELREGLDLHLNISLIDSLDQKEALTALKKGEIDLALALAEDMDSSLLRGESVELQLYYYSSGRPAALGPFKEVLKDYEGYWVEKNLAAANLPPTLIRPIELKERNQSNQMDQIRQLFRQLRKGLALLFAFGFLCLALLGLGRINRLLFEGAPWRGLQQLRQPLGQTYAAMQLMGSLYLWLIMGLALLGFGWALGEDQEGLADMLVIQFRELLPNARLWGMALALGGTAFFWLNLYLLLRSLGGWGTAILLLSVLPLFSLLTFGTGGLSWGKAILPVANQLYFFKAILAKKLVLGPLLLSQLSSLFWGALLAGLHFALLQKKLVRDGGQ